ncbi:unannotated protein [freshwater metagenome]|uniref:Unannotated protein n=1 Tax=freshwater metagenome TaxID=449393 RepID=A0A6J7FYC2_9ZZZZ
MEAAGVDVAGLEDDAVAVQVGQPADGVQRREVHQAPAPVRALQAQPDARGQLRPVRLRDDPGQALG